MAFKAVVTMIVMMMSTWVYASPLRSGYTQGEVQAAIRVLDRLATIPEPLEGFEQKNTRKLMKMRVATIEINRFALLLKGLRNGIVLPKDRVYALALLRVVIPDYVDVYLGNQDGRVQIREAKAFRQQLTTSPGLQMLLKMWEQHRF